MPKIYSGVPNLPAVNQIQSDAERTQFAAQVSTTLDALKEYKSNNKTRKKELFRQTDTLLCSARELFFDARENLPLRDDARRALLALRVAVKDINSIELHAIYPDLNSDIVICEKMILRQVEAKLDSPGIHPQGERELLQYVENIVGSTQTSENRELGLRILKKHAPEVPIPPGVAANNKARKRQRE